MCGIHASPNLHHRHTASILYSSCLSRRSADKEIGIFKQTAEKFEIGICLFLFIFLLTDSLLTLAFMWTENSKSFYCGNRKIPIEFIVNLTILRYYVDFILNLYLFNNFQKVKNSILHPIVHPKVHWYVNNFSFYSASK